MRQLSLSLLFFFFFSSQVLAAERQPGTDDYLRGEVGLSNEQLSKEIPTEQRSPFALADGKGTLYDPTGDVLTRAGTTSPVNLAWGDLITASIFKNEEQKSWYFTLEMAEAIPEKPSVNVNFLFYFDVDGEKTNNDVDGIRIHTDTQFIIAMNPTSFAWKPEYRLYNKEQNFWTFHKETKAKLNVQGTQVELQIPFEELAENWQPRWRAALAISANGPTQIDVVPGIGFPAPKGETYPQTSFDFYSSMEERNQKRLFIGIGLATALFIGGFLLKQRSTKNRKVLSK